MLNKFLQEMKEKMINQRGHEFWLLLSKGWRMIPSRVHASSILSLNNKEITEVHVFITLVELYVSTRPGPPDHRESIILILIFFNKSLMNNIIT